MVTNEWVLPDPCALTTLRLEAKQRRETPRAVRKQRCHVSARRILEFLRCHQLVGLKSQLYVVPYIWSKEAGKQSSELRMTFTWWRVVWDFTSHMNTLNEGWCETWHHITMHSMKGGVRLYITYEYTQWRVVWDLASHNNALNEGWCETWHHITINSMKGGVRLDIT